MNSKPKVRSDSKFKGGPQNVESVPTKICCDIHFTARGALKPNDNRRRRRRNAFSQRDDHSAVRSPLLCFANEIINSLDGRRETRYLSFFCNSRNPRKEREGGGGRPAQRHLRNWAIVDHPLRWRQQDSFLGWN